MEKIKIKKVRMTKRDKEYQLDANLIDRSKTIKDSKIRNQAFALHDVYLTERQSMKKAHARRKWKMFVMKNS